MNKKELDVVTSKVDLPDVPSGTTGTVVHVYPDGKAYEVEFVVSGKSVVTTVLNSQLN